VRWWRYPAAAGTVAAIVGVLQFASVSSDGIAATLLLLDVVVVARFLGFGPTLTAAALGAASYDYFFLPPVGFAIEKPEDWVGFFTFAITAVVAGELATRAERRAAEAQAGREENERLYRELKAAFERASDAEAARRNEALKAALLDALTHNLRTPLTGIKAAVTALIGSGIGGERELAREDRMELLHVIDEESDRLNRFIEALSTAERPEPSRPAHLRGVPLDAILRAALSRAEPLTRDHHVTVSPSTRQPEVSVDAAAMTEVIYILLDNASKYAPVGSTIAVRSAIESPREVRVTVSDEGPGIPITLREKVFEKFFRIPLREPHDSRRGGVGLGLPIARRLVEAQGGRIWIETGVAGCGSSAVVVLPTASESAEPGRPTPAVVLQS
jgi:two-component system sensor histidine kinase KdpD